MAWLVVAVVEKVQPMCETVRSYRDLNVRQKSIDLVTQSYETTRTFPQSEVYALSNQLQRSAVSVQANIAEGWGRDSTKEFLRHLSFAYGSLVELETHFEIASRLNYISDADVAVLFEQTSVIGKMLTNLKKSLRRRI